MTTGRHRRLQTVTRGNAPRRGAATVEFAVLTPLFLTLVLGTVEMGSALNHTQTLYSALREAGRLASMDYKQIVAPNTDLNTKITQDVKNFLTASGIPGSEVTVKIVCAGGTSDGQPFDLNDSRNDMQLFRIEASVPYTAVSSFPMSRMSGQKLSAQLTFRKGRVSLVTGS